MHFFFFSARPYDKDFRQFLIEALRQRGHDVWHIRIARTNVLTRPGQPDKSFSGIKGLLSLIRNLRAEVASSNATPVFVDSTGCCVPLRSLLLFAALRGLWCFDIYDDFRYNLHGFERLRQSFAISLLARVFPIQFVMSKELLSQFPRAFHVDNAGHTERVDRAGSNFRDLIILFSIDWRLDFDLLAKLARAAPNRRIVLYGRVLDNDAELHAQLDQLRAECPNIIYNGEYDPKQVDAILAPFGVGVTPYKADHVMTRCINPDKYYLFLGAGMEVITTRIPQSERMEGKVHIADSAAEVIEIAARIESDPSMRRNTAATVRYRWIDRADDFLKIFAARDTKAR